MTFKVANKWVILREPKGPLSPSWNFKIARLQHPVNILVHSWPDIVIQKEMLLVAFWYPNIRLFWQLSNKFHQKVTSTCYFQKKWIPKGHKSHFPIKSLLNYFAPKGHKYTQKLQTAKSCMQLIFIYRFLVHIVPYRKLFPMIYKCTMIF